jgi:hypothetical protein
MWPIISVPRGSKDIFECFTRVLKNESGALIIKDFWGKERCAKAMQGITKHGFEFYENVVPLIGRIGITEFEHASDDTAKARYFLEAPKANAVRQKIFKESGDPVEEVLRLFNPIIETRIAVEGPFGQTYFAGLVRNISEALLHLDFAPRDARGWDISKIVHQASWNLVLESAESGGETIVYRHPWKKKDESKKIPGSYGYEPIVVSNCEQVAVQTEVGDLFFFNSKNFHQVLPVKGRWTAVSSFIGLTKEDTLVLWS